METKPPLNLITWTVFVTWFTKLQSKYLLFSERIIFTSNLDVQQHILLLQTTLKLIHVESRLFQRKDLALRVDRRSLVLFHLVNFIISHGKIFSHISVNYLGPSHLFFFVWILNSYGTFAIFVCYFHSIKKMSYVK